MNSDFNKYLTDIGLTSVAIERTDEILDFYQTILKLNISDIFISEYVNNENNKIFENLWLFTSNQVGEAKDFLNRDDFDLVTLENSITYFQIEKEEFNFIDANTKSRLHIHISDKSKTTCDLKASHNNCIHLKAIMEKYILPNII